MLAHASHSKVYELKDVIADDSPRYSFYIWERKGTSEPVNGSRL